MSNATFHVGDALTVLKTLEAGSVDLVITSPPFLALRSYLPADHPDKAKEMGSEPDPGAYVDGLMVVVEELRRVLAPHGSLCIELGDTYAGSGGAGGDYAPEGLRAGQPLFKANPGRSVRYQADGHSRGISARAEQDGLPKKGANWPLAKSLSLIPETVRFTMAYGRNPHTGRQTEPWRIRNVIRWVRPNPPVGALGDKFRPATSEMLVACVSAKRYFDLDAVREPYTDRAPPVRPKSISQTMAPNTGGTAAGEDIYSNPAGAPPLDWWEIPTRPNEGETGRQVRVPLGDASYDIRRTPSPDCPQHASLDRQGSTPPNDEHANNGQNRNQHTDDHHASTPVAGSRPTPEPTVQTAMFADPADPAATTRNMTSNKTVPAPATNPSDTPSDQTPPHTAGTPTEPESSEPPPNTTGNKTLDGACQHGCEPGQCGHTADNQSTPACTCSFYALTTEDSSHYAGIPTDAWQFPTRGYRGAHYAAFPEQLIIKPVKAMSPEKVCKTCGEPSRRIVENSPDYQAFRDQQNADYADRDLSKLGARAASGSPGAWDNVTHQLSGAEKVTTGWTDCGHDNWRPGVVLDPFAGTGTVLQVATGHSRDAIGVDLDPRNADLALERVGPLFMEVIR